MPDSADSNWSPETKVLLSTKPPGPVPNSGRAERPRRLTRWLVGDADVDEQRHDPGGDGGTNRAGDRHRVHQECDRLHRWPKRHKLHRHQRGCGHDVSLPSAGAGPGRRVAMVKRRVDPAANVISAAQLLRRAFRLLKLLRWQLRLE